MLRSLKSKIHEATPQPEPEGSRPRVIGVGSLMALSEIIRSENSKSCSVLCGRSDDILYMYPTSSRTIPKKTKSYSTHRGPKAPKLLSVPGLGYRGGAAASPKGQSLLAIAKIICIKTQCRLRKRPSSSLALNPLGFRVSGLVFRGSKDWGPSTDYNPPACTFGALDLWKSPSKDACCLTRGRTPVRGAMHHFF